MALDCQVSNDVNCLEFMVHSNGFLNFCTTFKPRNKPHCELIIGDVSISADPEFVINIENSSLVVIEVCMFQLFDKSNYCLLNDLFYKNRINN